VLSYQLPAEPASLPPANVSGQEQKVSLRRWNKESGRITIVALVSWVLGTFLALVAGFYS
jgi:hypothetical protein